MLYEINKQQLQNTNELNVTLRHKTQSKYHPTHDQSIHSVLLTKVTVQ